jgi:hypothetical protein
MRHEGQYMRPVVKYHCFLVSGSQLSLSTKKSVESQLYIEKG